MGKVLDPGLQRLGVLMTLTMGKEIGDFVGQFVEMVEGLQGHCWGTSLQIRVKMDCQKPLRRGMNIQVDANSPLI